MKWRRWIARARLWFVAAFTYAFFLSGGGPQEATRFSLTESIVDRHVTDITAVHYRTIDKGYYRGKFYADKAPGLSLIATVPYASMRAADAVFGIHSEDRSSENAKLYVLSLIFAAAAGVGCVVLLRRLAELVGCSEPASELVAFAYAFGTIAFPFSTVLFGHQLAAFLVLGTFTYALHARNAGTLARPRTLVTLGALWALALTVEYPTGLLVAVLGLTTIAWTLDGARRLASAGRTIAWAAAGGAPILAAHVGFLWWTYGKIALPYAFVSEPFFRAHMSGGFLGIDVPTKIATYGTLFSSYRGIFFFCPILALSFVGIGSWLDSKADRRPLVPLLAALGLYSLFACSYYAWDGGGSTGPRHLLPCLPFAMLPIGFFVDRFRWAFAVTVAVALASAAVMLVTTFTLVQLPIGDPYTANPLYDLVIPAIVRGLGPLSPSDAFIPFQRADASTNWGLLLGMGARASLVVVPAVWAAAYLPAASRILRRRRSHA